MKQLLLIGAGKWGQNYISTLSNFHDIKLTMATRDNWRSLVDTRPDSVIVATGPHAHVEIAKHVLEHQIPLMIEKPLVLTLQELEPLLSLQHNAPILVNYTHLFANHFLELKKRLDKASTIFAESRGPGPIRSYSSLFDYGSHAVAMCLYLLNETPLSIHIRQEGHEPTTAFSIDLRFTQTTAHLMVGNNETTKKLWLEAYINKGFLVYNDLGCDKLISNHKPIDVNFVPPLTNAVQCFLSLMDGKQDDRAGLDLSIKVIKVLEECYKQASEVG